MCPPPFFGANPFYIDSRDASGGGGKELVTIDARGDSSPAIVLLHAQHASVTSDANVASQRDLLRKCEDKLNRAAGLNGCLHQEIEAPKADVPRLARLFGHVCARRNPDLQRKHH